MTANKNHSCLKIWITTDTHFGHEKVKEYCGRPDGFEALILDNLKNMVNKSDILLHLGDFAFGNLQHWLKEFQLIECRKWLIVGNHDKKSISYYLRNGFDFVAHSFEFEHMGQKILFSHKPLPDNDYDINIHGHFHNSNHHRHEPELLAIKNPRHCLLAIEHNDYKPFLLKDVIETHVKNTILDGACKNLLDSACGFGKTNKMTSGIKPK